jgi:hypothetical protein
MKTIFAWTEMVRDYPGYVNISRDEHGKHSIIVRERGHDGAKVARLEVTPELLESLMADLATDLYRDEQSGPADQREANLHAFLSSKGTVGATVTVQEVLDNWKTAAEQIERHSGLQYLAYLRSLPPHEDTSQ